MKIQVETKEMQEVIKKAMKVLPKEASLQALERLYIRAQDDKITAIATDLNLTIVIDIPGQVHDPGVTLIDATTLKMINNLKDFEITINQNSITAGKRSLGFVSSEDMITDYPCSLPCCNIEAFSTAEKTLLELLEMKYATNTDDTKLKFSNIVIDSTRAYTTDTFRVAIRNIPFENKLSKTILVSLDAVNILDKILDKKANRAVVCSVAQNEKQENTYVKFDTGDMQFYAKHMQETFLDIDKLIPKQFAAKIKVKRSNLLDELSLAKNLKTGNKGVPVTFGLDINNDVEINIKNGTHSFSATLDAEVEGDFSGICLDGNFLIDTLKHHREDDIVFNFVGGNKLVIAGEDLLMPINI